jgi:small ligand-binding sensory domain FIST
MAASALTLGWLYITDHYAKDSQHVLHAVRQQWPDVDWIGTVGVGVAASGVEYFNEPALVLMIADLPRSAYKLFSGRQPLGNFDAQVIQAHADGQTPDLSEVLIELSERTRSRYLFGGLTASRTRHVHWANEVLEGGISGVAFGPEVTLASRVTQGCQPVGRTRIVTECEHNVVYTLDDQPALDCLLGDLDVDMAQAQGLQVRRLLPRLRATLAGLSEPGVDNVAWSGQFGVNTRVRHLIGLEPTRRGLALADSVNQGMQLAFCQRNAIAARRDLVRICAEIREEVESEAPPNAPAAKIAGAIYVSCAGRGGPHFGGPSAELQIVRHTLGDVPLVGVFAAGEIAHRYVYGYSGVLTVILSVD